MTVSQIAEELDLTPQAVYHHVRKLVEGEMVEVAREVRVDHLIESYYRATAETFEVIVGKTPRGADVVKEQTATALNALKKLGFKIEFDEKTIVQLADLQVELSECKFAAKHEDAISNMEDVDLVTKLTVQEFAGILSMSNQEMIKLNETREKLVNLLRSLIKSKKD